MWLRLIILLLCCNLLLSTLEIGWTDSQTYTTNQTEVNRFYGLVLEPRHCWRINYTFPLIRTPFHLSRLSESDVYPYPSIPKVHLGVSETEGPLHRTFYDTIPYLPTSDPSPREPFLFFHGKNSSSTPVPDPVLPRSSGWTLLVRLLR